MPDLPAVLANSERVARYAHDKEDMAGHLRRQGIDLIEDLGPVRFTGPHSMTVEQVAELQLAYPTFTEGVSMAAQKICQTIGIGRFPQAWSYLGSQE